jgi:ubiquinone/menaquinone biosynthesis C-methylase UbiE
MSLSTASALHPAANPEENAYDKRVVTYESVTGFSGVMFEKMLETIAPQDGQHILDAGAGYAAVTQAVIKAFPTVKLDYHLLEKSIVQLERGRESVQELLGAEKFAKHTSFYHSGVEETPIESDLLDTSIAKMVIHEVRKENQAKTIAEMKRILKPGGRFIVWQTKLNDDNCHFFRAMMRRKDELSGFDSFVRDRYFLAESEFFALMNGAGFHDVKLVHDFPYAFSTRARMPDLGHDEAKLVQLNEFILAEYERSSASLKEMLNLQVQGDDVSVSFRQAIYSGTK